MANPNNNNTPIRIYLGISNTMIQTTVAMILINTIVIPFLQSWSTASTPSVTIIVNITNEDDDINLEDGDSLSVQSDWEDY